MPKSKSILRPRAHSADALTLKRCKSVRFNLKAFRPTARRQFQKSQEMNKQLQRQERQQIGRMQKKMATIQQIKCTQHLTPHELQEEWKVPRIGISNAVGFSCVIVNYSFSTLPFDALQPGKKVLLCGKHWNQDDEVVESQWRMDTPECSTVIYEEMTVLSKSGHYVRFAHGTSTLRYNLDTNCLDTFFPDTTLHICDMTYLVNLNNYESEDGKMVWWTMEKWKSHASCF